MTVPHKYHLAEKLVDVFRKTLQNEWDEKWGREHGAYPENFNQLKNQAVFFESLLDDIELSLKNKLGLAQTADILISTDSIRRILLNKNGNKFYQTRTLQTLSYYCGYGGFDDFCKKNGQLNDSHFSPIYPLKPSITTQKNIKFKISKAWILGTTSLLILCYISLKHFYPQTDGSFFTYQLSKHLSPAELNIHVNDKKLAQHENLSVKVSNVLGYYTNETINKPYISKQDGNFFLCLPGIYTVSFLSNKTPIASKTFTLKPKGWFGYCYFFDENTRKYQATKLNDWLSYIENRPLRKLSIEPSIFNLDYIPAPYRNEFYYSEPGLSPASDSVRIEFEYVSHAFQKSLDCKEFHVGFFSDNGTFLSVYGPKPECENEGSIGINYRYAGYEGDAIQFKQKYSKPRRKSIVGVLEVKKNTMTYTQDGDLRAKIRHKRDIGKFATLVLSYNYPQEIKYVKVFNSYTNKLLFEYPSKEIVL